MMRPLTELLGDDYGHFGEFTYLKLNKVHPISEDEKVILRNLPEEYKNGWIARDLSGLCYVHSKKPIKGNRVWMDSLCEGNNENLHAFSHIFKCIKWSDEEPTYIPNLLEDM